MKNCQILRHVQVIKVKTARLYRKFGIKSHFLDGVPGQTWVSKIEILVKKLSFPILSGINSMMSLGVNGIIKHGFRLNLASGNAQKLQKMIIKINQEIEQI